MAPGKDDAPIATGGFAVAKIRIMFSRFSAFYSPLIATEAGGFLKAEGWRPRSRWPRRTARPGPAWSTARSI